jgi:hypothetical protein
MQSHYCEKNSFKLKKKIWVIKISRLEKNRKRIVESLTVCLHVSGFNLFVNGWTQQQQQQQHEIPTNMAQMF